MTTNRQLAISAGIAVMMFITWIFGRLAGDGNKIPPAPPSSRHQRENSVASPRPPEQWMQNTRPHLMATGSPLDHQPLSSEDTEPNPHFPATTNGLIDELRYAMKGFGKDANSVRATLSELRKQLSMAEPQVATQAILFLLERGEDAVTGLKWQLSPAGRTLANAPTARTFMLDVLGEINPEAAADYSEKIFALSNSPDEWALSLRNLAWDNVTPTGDAGPRDASLHQHFLALLARQDWQQSPGYYEAFDTLAYLGDAEGATERVAAMSHFLQENSQNPALGAKADAAYLALDEYSRACGANAYQLILASSNFSAVPQSRASLLSTTIPHSGDLALTEDYLAQPQISVAEKKQFLVLYPNYNEFAGGRLLRGNIRKKLPQSPAEIDRAALRQLTALAADSRFDELEPALSAAVERIREFIHQLDARASLPSPPVAQGK